MEDINIELKPKKKSFLDKIKDLFEDKKKRYLYMMLFILPFVIAIGVFGFITYREAKTILDLAKSEEQAVKDDNYKISSMDYVLRANATDYQKQLFAELKDAVEVSNADDKTLASLVSKNFIADFYTWTNKQGQYDVGGMYYICDSKTEDFKYNENFYIKARDSFYKYLSKYIKDYGAKNLIEVDNVNVISCSDLGYPYSLYELSDSVLLEDGDVERTYSNVDHNAYYIKLNWTYKPETKLDLSQFATSIDLIVIEADGRYEIVEMSEKEIDARQLEEEDEEELKDEDEISEIDE